MRCGFGNPHAVCDFLKAAAFQGSANHLLHFCWQFTDGPSEHFFALASYRLIQGGGGLVRGSFGL